jgi:hypothetical protein
MKKLGKARRRLKKYERVRHNRVVRRYRRQRNKRKRGW